MSERPPLLQVDGLTVDFKAKRGKHFRAVDSVDLTVASGETVGIVGESGSGKSTIARAILGIGPAPGGTITFAGKKLDPYRVRRRQPVTDIQPVFQDPTSSLDPTKTVGYTIAEPLVEKLRREGRAVESVYVRARVDDMLKQVGLPAAVSSRYPAQFSGGQRQRLAIARALIVEPKLVLCDEPLSAMDLSIQAQILNVLMELQRKNELSYLFISHDLSVVEHICDRVVVLYRGRVAEMGTPSQIRRAPQHPYTRALLAAVLVQEPERRKELRALRERYRVASSTALPLGERCAYTHRCPFAIDVCLEKRPVLEPTASGAVAACHRHGELPDNVVGAMAAHDADHLVPVVSTSPRPTP